MTSLRFLTNFEAYLTFGHFCYHLAVWMKFLFPRTNMDEYDQPAGRVPVWRWTPGEEGVCGESETGRCRGSDNIKCQSVFNPNSVCRFVSKEYREIHTWDVKSARDSNRIWKALWKDKVMHWKKIKKHFKIYNCFAPRFKLKWF